MAERGAVPFGYPLKAVAGDPDNNRSIFWNIDIFVDGDLIDEVVAFDVEEGWVKFAPRDAAGCIQVVDDEVLYETRHGRVDLRYKEA